MAVKTLSVAGGNFSANATWDEGAPPATTEDVVCRGGGDSGTLTHDVTNQQARSFDFHNYSGTWTYPSKIVKIGSTALGANSYALYMPVGMSTSQTGGTVTFVSTTTGNTITSNANALNNVTFNGTGGGWTLQDALSWNQAGALTLTAGTFNSNGKTLGGGSVVISGATTRTATLDNSTINCGLTSGTPWSAATTTNLTFSATGSTINITNGSASAKTFAGGGLTYGTVAHTSTGAGGLTVTGANTFATFTETCTSSRSLTLPASATNAITSALTLKGLSGSQLTVQSSSSGTPATISAGGGVNVVIENCSIKDITASGGATFTAVNCVNVSGNTGITFVRRARGWGVQL